MRNITQTFLNAPVPFLHHVPFLAMAQSQNGLTVENLQVMYDDRNQYAALWPTPHGQAGAMFYVLSWDYNHVAVGTLGNHARFFFTGPLSGCMFAVDKNWYTPRVVHANQMHAVHGMNVPHMTNSINNQMAGSTSRLKWWLNAPNITVVQSHNRNAGEAYNIFGYRTGGGWTFWQQVCDQNANPMTVLALNELDTWF